MSLKPMNSPLIYGKFSEVRVSSDDPMTWIPFAAVTIWTALIWKRFVNPLADTRSSTFWNCFPILNTPAIQVTWNDYLTPFHFQRATLLVNVSQDAYGTAAHFQVLTGNGLVCLLMMTFSKDAPLKVMFDDANVLVGDSAICVSQERVGRILSQQRNQVEIKRRKVEDGC